MTKQTITDNNSETKKNEKFKNTKGNFRGRGGRYGRGGNKPPPLMSLPPPMSMRRPLLPHGPMEPLFFPGPGPRMGPRDMGPMHMPPPFPRGPPRGMNPRGRGMMSHPMSRHGPMMFPPGRMPLPHLPVPFMMGELPPPMFRGPGRRGRPPPVRGMRGRGKGRGGLFQRRPTIKSKPKDPNSQTGELNKPWVTEVIKNEILKKHKLHQKAKKGNNKEDWETFREHRNKVTTILREAKLEYIAAHPEEDATKILADSANPDSVNAQSNEAAGSDAAAEESVEEKAQADTPQATD